MAAKRHFKERLNLHGVFTGNRNIEVLEHNVAATSAEVRKSTRPHKIKDFGSEWICEDLNLPDELPSMHQKNNLNNLVSYTKDSSIMENVANSDFTKKAVLNESNIKIKKRKRGRPSKQISQNNNDPQHGSNIRNKKRKRGRPSKQISQNVENVNENINHNLNQILDVSLIELPTKGNRVNIDSKHGSNIEKEKLKQGELSKKINQNIVLEVKDAPDLFDQSSINSAVIVTDTATKIDQNTIVQEAAPVLFDQKSADLALIKKMRDLFLSL